MNTMNAFHFIAILLAIGALVSFYGCNVGINKSIYIKNGETLDYGPKSVNGSIIIGNDCIIEGSCDTVNGKIELGTNCRVKNLKTVNRRISVGKSSVVDGEIGTVNGSISCDDGVEVDENLSTVNGSITCGAGVKVGGNINTVNGDIDLKNTTVKENIRTLNGNITLQDKSIVERDIIIKKGKHSITGHFHHQEIRITEDSLVNGNILVEDEEMKVKVYLSKGGQVKGQIKGAEVIQE